MAKARLPLELPLVGDRVRLDALQEDDLAALAGFFRRPDQLYYYVPVPVFPRTLPQLRKTMAEWNDCRRNFTFAIRFDDRLAGLIHLDDVDLVNGSAEIGIAITEPDARGKGLAADAIRTMLNYAFGELRLERVMAHIIDGNEPSLKLFTGLGFVKEGLMRHVVRRSGGWLDMHVFSMLSGEWAERAERAGLTERAERAGLTERALRAQVVGVADSSERANAAT